MSVVEMVCITGDIGRGDNSCRISGPSILRTALDLSCFLIVDIVVAVFGCLFCEEASDGATSDSFAEKTIIYVCLSSLMSILDTTS